MKRIVSIFVLFALVGYALTVFAQAPSAKPEPAKAVAAPVVPTLTAEKRLTIEGIKKDITIAQQAARLAQQDFEKAVAALQAFMRENQVPGHDLDIDKLVYTPTPVKK